ncbi:hypothetical protein IFR05_001467 [Cadophora sp. M221]|nr:hypothetical protein IFR05_001467 [Cadophora sp. M221]
MAPRRSAKIQAPVSASEDEDEQQTSQDDGMNMIAAEEVLNKNNERRDKKRRAIEAEYEKRVKDVKARIDALFAARKSRVSKAHQAAWARLDTLDKKRQNIEGLILGTMKDIETRSIQLCAELAVTFEDRLEEMEGRQSPEE